jgi:hypothetical protein
MIISTDIKQPLIMKPGCYPPMTPIVELEVLVSALETMHTVAVLQSVGSANYSDLSGNREP